MPSGIIYFPLILITFFIFSFYPNMLYSSYKTGKSLDGILIVNSHIKIMPIKQTLIKILKVIASDVRQAAVPAILLLLVGGSAGLLLFSQKALNFSKQIANTPTPLWATIVLILVVVGYVYIKNQKKIQSPETEPPDYKLCYFTIGNYKWEVKVYKSGYFKVNEYPFCVKHDLKFIFGNNGKYCPGTENEQCNNSLHKYDEFKIFEAAKSIIENKIRNKKC